MPSKRDRPIPCPSGLRLEILVLLISHSELSGAQLVTKARFKRGSIYSTLKRLSQDQLIESRSQAIPGIGGPPRRYWRPTRLGRRAAKVGIYATRLTRP